MKSFPPILTLGLFALASCSSDSNDDPKSSDSVTGDNGATGGVNAATGGDGAAPSDGGVAGSGGSSTTSGGASSGGAGSGGVPSGGIGSGGLASGGAPDENTGGTGGTTTVGIECGLPALSAPVNAATAPLTVLDWAGMNAAVSYSFDDANSTQVSAYDTINALGVPFTFYVTTNWIGNPANWAQALADGHEIGNHTTSHPSQATDAELDNATAYIEDEIGVTPLTMAAPNGDTSYSSFAMSRFLLNRGVGGGSIAPLGSTNLYNAPTFIPPEGAGKSQLDSGVGGAISQGHWQTVTIHAFEQGGYQPISLSGFVEHVTEVRDSGEVWIDTMLAVGSYYVGQKLVSDAAPATNGTESTWSWSLPAHFPEGRCLRITSTGTVLQDGALLPQDPLGYYEISLDEGAVTVRD